jgi:hypothetical protein
MKMSKKSLEKLEDALNEVFFGQYLKFNLYLPVIEKSSIINQIKLIRERLNSNQPNINLIISSLATLSKQAGFLNIVKQDIE